MNIEQRKELVQKILSKGKKKAEEEVAAIHQETAPTYDFLFAHLKSYVLAKFMLDPDTSETDIKTLASLSLAKMMKLDRNVIHSLDQATPCDHATSESTKKVLLLYSVQKDLHLVPDSEKLAKVNSLEELAEYVLSAQKKKYLNSVRIGLPSGSDSRSFGGHWMSGGSRN